MCSCHRLKFCPTKTSIMEMSRKVIRMPTCDETRDRISSKDSLSYSAWMDDLDPFLIGKQEPW